MISSIQATDESVRPAHGDAYGPFLASIRDHFSGVVDGGQPLFTTDAQGLFPAFLYALPAEERQHHTCHSCRHFVERFGDLVTIAPDGRTVPVMWGPAPGFYEPAFAAVRRVVARAKVTGVFLSSQRVWGTPETGAWRHMAVTPPAALVFRGSVLKNASQAMAEKREEYGMLQRGLAEFPAEIVAQALTILEAEALYRSEKVVGPARWLADLHAKRGEAKGATARDNVTWLAVAGAPAGFAHVRSTMVGTLLEDLAAGMPFDAVRRRFADKMSPLQYQRPQAPPTAGNIARAEKIVAELRSAGALARRFARIDDIQSLWTPKPSEAAQPSDGTVFGHLATKGKGPQSTALDLPPVTITWEKLARTVLPNAERIEFYVPAGRTSYIALVTAENPDAPPILQWDSEEKRNPVSWYLYHGGSLPAQWSLSAGSRVSVTAITQLPCMWHDPDRFAHQGAGVIFILDGCRDTEARGGATLFPETLRAEYREIRSTIEAYSRSATLGGADEASACGIDLRKGGAWNHLFRVTALGSSQAITYKLDRWD